MVRGASPLILSMIKTLKTFAFHLPSLSVGLTFFTLSMLFGSWLARLPEVQARLMLSEGQLGLALLGLPVGALLMMPLAGWLSARLSSGQAMTLSTLLFCGAIMSVCHGMFSLGAMVGAGSSGLIASLGVSLQVHLITVALLMVGLHLLLRPVIHSLPSAPAENNGLSIPPRALLGLCRVFDGDGHWPLYGRWYSVAAGAGQGRYYGQSVRCCRAFAGNFGAIAGVVCARFYNCGARFFHCSASAV